MAKQMVFESDAREAILRGVDKLAKAVTTTLGPRGRNAVIDKGWGAPTITKDGVTVAEEIQLQDPYEQMGAQLVKEVAAKTSDVAGDGTTTATVLASAIFDEGLKYLAAGVNPQALRTGIEKAVDVAVTSIESSARKIKTRAEKAAIATISANNDSEIGNLLADAFEKVGDEGVITVEENKGIDTILEHVEGMEFDKGYLSPYFATDLSKLVAEYEDAHIFICNKKISTVREMVPALEAAMRSGKPLLIIAEDIEGEALTALVINRLKGVLNVAAVKAPGFGDRRKSYLEDIAALTGGVSITDEIGIPLEQVTVEHFGSAARVVVGKDSTTIIQGAGKKKAVDERAKQIRVQIEKSSSDYDKEKLEERLAKLTGGVAVIRVGGKTEAEMKEKKDRVEDALNATRAAIQEGIVPGGGVALLNAAEAVNSGRYKNDEKFGALIIERALQAPCRQIAENAGVDGSVVAETIREKGKTIGYNALTGAYEDMFKAGVIDPAKVVRSALQNAASISGLLLTTDSMITDIKNEETIEGSVN